MTVKNEIIMDKLVSLGHEWRDGNKSMGEAYVDVVELLKELFPAISIQGLQNPTDVDLFLIDVFCGAEYALTYDEDCFETLEKDAVSMYTIWEVSHD